MRRARNVDASLEETNLLELTPVRLAAWREIDGRVVLERPRPRGQGVRGWLERVSNRLAPQRLRLDDLGAFAWARLDGRATVAELAGAIRERFGADAEPVEERLGQYVRMLRREGLLAYPGWDDVPFADGPRRQRCSS